MFDKKIFYFNILETRFETPDIVANSCTQPAESELNKTVDTDEMTCFTLPVSICNTCFDEYNIKISFNLSYTTLGGNVRRVAMKVTDIPCNQTKVFAGKSTVSNSVLYTKCIVNDGDAGWCEGSCNEGFADKNKMTIILTKFSSLQNASQICEIIFV